MIRSMPIQVVNSIHLLRSAESVQCGHWLPLSMANCQMTRKYTQTYQICIDMEHLLYLNYGIAIYIYIYSYGQQKYYDPISTTCIVYIPTLIHYKWSCSIARLNYQGVSTGSIPMICEAMAFPRRRFTAADCERSLRDARRSGRGSRVATRGALVDVMFVYNPPGINHSYKIINHSQMLQVPSLPQ